MRPFLHTIWLFVVLLAMSGQTRAQGDKAFLVDLPGGAMTIREILTAVEKATGMGIYYMQGTLDPGRQLMTKKGKLPFRKALDLLLADRNLHYSLEDENIFIKRNNDFFNVGGYYVRVIVTDEDGQPLPGAVLQLQSAREFFTTDTNGTADLRVRKLSDTLLCSALGRWPFKIRLTSDAVIRLEMRPNETMLHEAVVAVAPLYNGYAGNPGANTIYKSQLARNVNRVDRLELADRYLSNPLSSLGGRISGMLVTQTSGVYGAGVSLLLRGRMSIVNGSDPLIIIDGVPFAPGNQSLSNVATGNAAGSLSPFSFIATDDIERIEVLKDAAATSIWGSRGANGVIEITTRQGAPGKRHPDIGIEKGVSLVTRRPSLMHTRDYRAMRLEALRNDSLVPDGLNAHDLVRWDTIHNTDWGKYFVGGLENNLNFQLSENGGTNRTNHFLGLHHYRETDVFPDHPKHDLSTLTTNINHRSGRLTISANGMFGIDNNEQYTMDLTSFQFLAPDAPPLPSKNVGSGWLPVLNYRYTAHSYNYLAGAKATYQLDSNIWIHNNIGISRVSVQEHSTIPASLQDRTLGVADSTYYANTRYYNWIFEPQLEYRRRMGRWATDLFAGVSWQRSRNTIGTAFSTGYSSPEQQNGQAIDYTYRRYFTRLDLRWKDRYMVELTGSREGSNRWTMGRHNDFGTAGFAWIFSNEPGFRRLLPLIGFGKFTGSYAITGNDQIGRGYMSFGNPSWEKINKQELGLELGILDNRLVMDVAWYRNRSGNQLLPDGFSPIGGLTILSSYPVVVQNKGWEFNFTSKNIDHKDFEWTTAINASLPVNKLVSFPGLAGTSFSKDLTVGRSLTSNRLYEYTGVDKNSGIFQFRDVDHDNKLTDADKTASRSLDVTFYGGILNTLSWHGWRLSTLIEARVQQGIDYQTAFYAQNPPGSILSGIYGNVPMKFADRWRKAGDQATYQRLTTTLSSAAGRAISSYLASNAMLTDASFVRLKSIALSYQLPEEVLRKMHLHELRFSLKGENLWTVTPYSGADPEIQNINILPPMRTVVAGVEIRF